MALHIGTSGWAYPEWQPAFYPAGLPRARFLEHYARTLTACEINATFYRLQSESTFEKWAAAVPDGFRFAVKAHRRLTHTETLAGSDDDLAFAARFRASVERLGDRLGILLVQFPASRRADPDGLDRLLTALAGAHALACEFRHASWDDGSVDGVLARCGAGRCLADRDGAAPDALPPGPAAYVRLRAEHYNDAQREAWRALLDREATGRPVFAFAKHEGVPAGNPHAGVGLAEWLVGACG